MQPGNVTEMIERFAGYLHMFRDPGRDHVVYEDALPQRVGADEFPFQPQAPSPPPDEEFSGGPSPAPLLPMTDDGVHAMLQALRPIRLQAVAAAPLTPQKLPPLPAQHGTDHGYAFNVQRGYSITYKEGGDQLDLRVHQTNLLHDDDTFGGEASPDHIAAVGEAQQIIAHWMEDGPREAWHQRLFGDGADPVAAVLRYQEAASGPDSGPSSLSDAQPLTAGRHVDGVLGSSDEAVVLPEKVERAWPEDACGQVAETGGNVAVNAATILDAHDFRGHLVVLGDYWRTDAIIQINAYCDRDTVEGNPGAGPALADAPTTATNVAEFLDRPVLEGGLPDTGLGRYWNVDIHEGDFFDIKTVCQTNWISDNDYVVQQMTGEYQYLSTGLNNAVNSVDISSLGKFYDIVIVLGAYREVNAIFQTNLLVDNDHVVQSGAMSDGTGSAVATAGNQLFNYAAIDKIGGTDYLPVGADLNAFVQDLLDQDGHLDFGNGWQLGGTGTFVDVLIVTGNYYDINIVDQLNIVSDADTLQQVMSCYGGSMTQQAVTGDNLLMNAAAIVDVGSAGHQFVGGVTYSDAVLVQTEIVVPADEAVTVRDTQALAGEVIAFLGEDAPAQTQEAAPDAAPSSGLHHDMLGHLLT